MDLLLLDYVIIAALLVSAALSLIRGFTKEVLSIVSWIIAAYAALFFSPALKPYLAQYVQIDGVVNIGAFLIIFVVVLVVVSMLMNAVSERFKKHTPGILDHSLGMAFGLARGALIVSLAYFALVLALPEDQHPDWIRNAKTRPLMQTGIQLIVALVPLDRLPANISEMPTIRGIVPLTPPDLSPTIPQDKPDEKGYKDADRKLMERLIRNTEEGR